MNTWVPLWTSTVQSTLWEEPTHVRVMFLTMLLLRDPDHVVRMPFRRLVKAANLAQEVEESARLAEDALKVLLEPDARSIDDQEFGGRRIKVVEGGWLILNGGKYQEEMMRLTARLRKSAKQRERRERERKQEGPVSQKYRDREARFVEAEKNGDVKKADRIAAEGLAGRVVPALLPEAGDEKF